ncbi:hypothetical protein GC163_13985 [bacterium]|nr:hypothetical protein [bacterium]
MGTRPPTHHRSVPGSITGRNPRSVRPAAAFRQRGVLDGSSYFSAPEDWHEPQENTATRLVVQSPGHGYVHAVTADEVRARLAELPEEIVAQVEVVQLSRMTRKKALFPRYGMQWGENVYLYPIEESLVERYLRPPRPEQIIEARMYGGEWAQVGSQWHLTWTAETLRDFYLNNVLIHEIGHVVDTRNTNPHKREQFANWFAIEYGYRPTRGRR